MNFNYKKYNNIIYLFLIFFLWSPKILGGGEENGGIISLKPNITEILFELGMGDRVVGVTTYCNHPNQAKKIQKVADYVHVDVEKIIALKPSLVIGSRENSIQKEIEFLKNEGISVSLFSFDHLSETYDSIRSIARLLHGETRGEEIIQRMKNDLVSLHEQVQQNNRSVLMVVGTRPLVVVGGKNLLDDILQKLGLPNLARGSNLKYPTYTLERLIASQPEVIFDLTMGSEKSATNSALAWYQRFDSIPAVQKNHVYFLNMGDFLASPRLIVGAKQLVELMR